MEPPRSAEQRKKDTLTRLEHDEDAWVATADSSGDAYLVPLSFLWDGARFVVSTPTASPTARNLTRGGRVRVAVGPTRDLVVVDGTGLRVADDELPAVADAFVEKVRWDPRGESGDYGFYGIVPSRIQAWREANELRGRTLMRDGAWLT